jgi:hypothetical protein
VKILAPVVIRKAAGLPQSKTLARVTEQKSSRRRSRYVEKIFKKSSFFKKIICKRLEVSCLNVKLTVTFSSFSECDKREAMKKIKSEKRKGASGGTTVGFCERSQIQDRQIWELF